jgi:hypothetical protein
VIENIGVLVEKVSPEAIVAVAVIYGLTIWIRKKKGSE